VPELSRRPRGIPTWAVLRSLGRDGVARLVEGLADAARGIAEGVGRLPGVEVLNDVVFTQVCIALDDDASTAELSKRLWDDGEVLAMTSAWKGRTVVRFSVSNWGTDATQVARTVRAVERALAEVRSADTPSVD
jgi:glutamate/tyrosine decarboxylase-like PLP-dependent enzyme